MHGSVCLVIARFYWLVTAFRGDGSPIQDIVAATSERAARRDYQSRWRCDKIVAITRIGKVCR